MKKGIKAFLTFIIFAIGMAFCIAVSFDSKVEKWLLQYAVIAGAVLLGIFFIGLLILFLAVKAGSEKGHQIGTFLSLPFLYFGMTCLFVLAERICIHRMFATEVAETAAQTSAVSSSLMLAGFVMSVIVAAIIFNHYSLAYTGRRWRINFYCCAVYWYCDWCRLFLHGVHDESLIGRGSGAGRRTADIAKDAVIRRISKQCAVSRCQRKEV